MSLLVLMYHRAIAGPHGNRLADLDAQLAYIARHFTVVRPGERSARGNDLCLTFDDATYDFYALVMPLLRFYRLPATLAVPTGLIIARASRPPTERIHVSSADAFARPELEAFCTWRELEEIAVSKLVTFAAHGHRHKRLDEADANLTEEIIGPGAELRARLHTSVDSFVFPYGRWSPAALTEARQHYRHCFRIGGGDNAGWNAPLTYRIDADNQTRPDELFSHGRRLRYRARRWWNQLRQR